MRGMLLMIRAGRQASRHSELIWAGIPYCVLHTCLRSVAPMELGRMLALRADMGRNSELRSSYLRKICRSYGDVF